MAVATIGNAAAPSSTVLQTANLSQQDFLRILLTQLTFQDPLKPLDNQAFVAQLAQFTTLAQTQGLNSRLDNLLTLQAGSQSVTLLGRTVDVSTASGNESGRVSGLQFDATGQPLLTITTSTGAILSDIALSQVTSIR